jgi:MFS family permease
VTLNQLMITIGIVVAYCAGLAFSGSGDWRAMFALGLFPAAVLLFGMLRAPETPAWLERRGEHEPRAVGIGTLVRSAAAPAVLIGVTLAVVQQFAGINAVIAYAPTIMERTGLTASNSILYSVAIGVANVAATVIRWIDRRGRRPLLLASTAGTGASLLLLGLTFEVSLGDWGSWLALLCLVAYVCSFAVGLGPVFWVLIGEIFPPEARAAGAGLATAVNWFSSFVVSLVFVPLADAIGQGATFWAFAGVCAFGFVLARRYVPETKGRSLGEIEAEVRARFGHRPRRIDQALR